MLKILNQVVEDLLYGMPSNKNIEVHLHTYNDATSPKMIDFHLTVQ